MKQINYFIGTVGSDIRSGMTDDKKQWVGFRMAVNHDYFDTKTGDYQPLDTTWFDVSAFGTLATHVLRSVVKGDSVIVCGRLRTRDWVSKDGRTGTANQVLAEVVGLNLQFSSAISTRKPMKDKSEQNPEGVNEYAERPDNIVSREPEPVLAGAEGGESGPPF